MLSRSGHEGPGGIVVSVLIDVTDPSDARLADFVGLRDAQLRRADGGRFIAEGVKIIERALAAGEEARERREELTHKLKFLHLKQRESDPQIRALLSVLHQTWTSAPAALREPA